MDLFVALLLIMLSNIHDIWQKCTDRSLIQNVVLLTIPAACCYTFFIHNPVKNNVNNFQHIPMNFSESTIVRGLKHHFYQKHKLNIILIIGSEMYSRFYTPQYNDWTVDTILRANCSCSKIAIYGIILSRVSMPKHAECDIVMANPSVCLSVTLWCRIETDAHIVRHFPPSGSGVTTFWAQPPLQNYKENSLSGCVKHTGVWKFAIFDRNCVSGNGTRQVHGHYGLLIGSHSHMLLAPESPKSFDPPANARMVWDRATKFGTVTHMVAAACFSGLATAHILRGGAPAYPKMFGTPRTWKRFNLQQPNLKTHVRDHQHHWMKSSCTTV